MKLDLYTFGNSPAAVKLAGALNELGNKQTTAKTSSFLVALCTKLKRFSDSNLSASDKHWAMYQALESFKHSVNTTTSTLPIPKTLMLNVGKMHCQEYIKKNPN